MYERVLVTGGTGKTGRRVVERLERLGVPVRVGSRANHPPFDWADRGTWPAALDGWRVPRDFADYARRTAASGVWDAAPEPVG